MELDDLRQHWTAFGRQDPLWAILTTPGKRGGGWDLDEFFATGRPEVDEVFQMLAARGIAIETGRALDFGSGVGRLTRALAEHFDSCDGVDVAATMIERAREFNCDGERVRFHHNDAADLGLFADESFDFVLALIVLQHMRPPLMQGYIREFLRVLRPAGVAFFNVPERFEAGEELPPEARRASLALSEGIPTLLPGQVAQLKLTVRNESPLRWPKSAQVRVGDHWLTAEGAVLTFDDGRATIDTALDPGGEYELRLDVTPPVEPGHYVLEVDALQEWIAWFANTLSVPVEVAGAADVPSEARGEAAERREDAPSPSAVAPRMEMHVMAREDVIATLEEAGGVVLDAVPRDRCGPLIPSVDYLVARALSPGRSPASRVPGPSLMPLDLNPAIVTERRRARETMDDRADLVEFDLTSTLRRLGRASLLVRSTLRRAMYQVLRRQTDFNQATSARIQSLEAEVQALTEAVSNRLDALEVARDEAAEQAVELERRIARVEVDAVMLARRVARGSGPAERE
jgi:SAM-dependent methyltransferase